MKVARWPMLPGALHPQSLHLPLILLVALLRSASSRFSPIWCSGHGCIARGGGCCPAFVVPVSSLPPPPPPSSAACRRSESPLSCGIPPASAAARPRVTPARMVARADSADAGAAADGAPRDGGGEKGGEDERGGVVAAVRRLLPRTVPYALTFFAGLRLGRRGMGGGPAAAGDVAASSAEGAARRLAAPAAAARRFPALPYALLAAAGAREVWRAAPEWARKRVMRRVRSTFSRAGRAGDAAAAEAEDAAEIATEDPDDMTSVGNVARKLQGLLADATTKMSGDGAAEEPLNLRASLLALLQFSGQLKAQRAEERDKLYESSGVPGRAEDLEGLREGFEFADWAYDEDPGGLSLKENLEQRNFTLVRHDKTAIPGYVGHYVALCPSRKMCLIGVKGTSTFEDLLTDCCGRAVTHAMDGPFVPGGEAEIRCHEGVLISARRLANEIQPLVSELFLPSGYRILLTGHSLGAGVSALLAILLRSRIPELRSDQSGDLLKVWAYASPPVLDHDSALQCSPFITTIVNNADVIPRASMANLLILLEFLKVMDDKLEERGIVSSDGVNAIALFKKLSEGQRGEMLVRPEDFSKEINMALEKVELCDPDHLYVPGRVIAMYERWQDQEEEDTAEGEAEETDDEEGPKTQEGNVTKIPERNVRLSNGTMKVLRYIEIDEKMVADHLSPSYRKILGELTALEPVADKMKR